MRRMLALSCLLLAATAATAGAPQTAAATAAETDQAKFVRLTRQLEREPLQDTSRAARAWLVEWADSSPDIEVLLCDILPPLTQPEVPNRTVLLGQLIFGNAAFQIAHPERKHERLATQTAGVRSVIATYAMILVTQPDARIPEFDALLAKERAGELEQALAPRIAAKCSGKDG